MKSFRFYLGRPGIWASRLACFLARRTTNDNRKRRLYRLAMWLAVHSSPFGSFIALSIGIEAAAAIVFGNLEKMIVVDDPDEDSE